MIKMFTGEPFLLNGISPNTSKDNRERDSGESSMTGISTRNLGCFTLLSLLVSLVLLRGFSSVLERHVLAWRMADSFEVGGLEEGVSMDDQYSSQEKKVTKRRQTMVLPKQQNCISTSNSLLSIDPIKKTQLRQIT
ncbi:hypothetical protein G4B88_028074 [Cannabis sativa]|uniref:Uncharacterized protein n=1 Tax=Cannabis sativa TaxID=3483 RepID=A0A7J6HKZ2_CANSA|nr:hypothetical protein G4B88_028074 [Cannabis sativa]